jgi:hypothetical protein
VSPSPSPHLYPLRLEPAHLPDPLLDSILQLFNANVLDQRSPSHLAPPAASPCSFQKRTTTPTTQ